MTKLSPQNPPEDPMPPRIAARLLHWMLPRQVQEELLGNLEEDFLLRQERDGLRAARAWYRRQALSCWVRWIQLLRKSERFRPPQHVSQERAEGYAMEGLIQDLRFGMRTLWKKKLFSAMVVLTLALAIGANTTIFSMVSTLLLQPVPFTNTSEIAFIWMSNPEINRPRISLSLDDFRKMRDQLTTFQGLSAARAGNFNLRSDRGAAAVRLEGYRTTPNFFSLMGIELDHGRSFLPEEARSGRSGVAVLAHRTWKSQFGSSEVLNRDVVLDGVNHRIVGVLTPEMEVGPFRDAEIWLPLETDATGLAAEQRSLLVAGRLGAGQTLDSAQQEVSTIATRLVEEKPEYRGWVARVFSVTDALLGSNAQVVLAILVITVSFVLLIACSNVANMVLARSFSREGEIALRSALGASRARILRQLLTENLILSILGAAAGMVLANLTLRLMILVTRARGPFVRFTLDPDVLMFALLLGVLTPLLFGFVPAVRIIRNSPAAALKEGRALGAGGRLIGRRVFVAAEVALSLVMLVVAGLAVQSARNITDIALGFEPTDVLTFRIDRPVRGEASQEQFLSELKTRLESIPGVINAAFSSHRPIVGGEPFEALRLSGSSSTDPENNRTVLTALVSNDFFASLRIPILQGREFSATDRTELRLAVINEAAWTLHWEGRTALGSQLFLGSDPAPWEVVGVVSNLRNPDADQPSLPQVYVPINQSAPDSFAVLVHSPRQPAELLPAIRREIGQIDPDVPIYDTRTMQEILYDDQASDYAMIGLMSFFSLIALGLAAAGIYALTAFSVNRRLHEFGIRLAVGARPRDVIRMVLKQSLTPVLIGILLGVLGAYWVARIIAGQLYGIVPTDPATFATVVGSLLLFAIVASSLPALRAVRSDLVKRLRA